MAWVVVAPNRARFTQRLALFSEQLPTPPTPPTLPLQTHLRGLRGRHLQREQAAKHGGACGRARE